MTTRPFLFAAALALLSACATARPAPLDSSALARLTDAQMKPIDEARVELGRSKDRLARTQAGKVDAANNLTVAKAEQEVAAAEMKQNKAALDLAVGQKADGPTLDKARAAVAAGEIKMKASELHVTYQKDLVGGAALEEAAAQAHLASAEAALANSEFDALAAAGSTAVANKKSSDYQEALARAQAAEAAAKSKLAEANVGSVTDYNRWQEREKLLPAAAAPTAPTAPAAPAAK
jgi:hypothetical protein